MSSAVIGLRTEKTQDNVFGWKIVTQIPSDEPCVVYLGGDGTSKDRAANGYAKSVERELLGTIGIGVPIYSVKYDWDGHLKEWARQCEFVKRHQELSTHKIRRVMENISPEEINPQYIDDLYSKMILPRISQQEGQQRLSAEEACRRVRMMTFVGHCHGAYVALKLEEKMQTAMETLGYNLDERRKIQSQMMVLAHAPACPLGVTRSQMISFKTVYDRDTPVSGNWFNNYLTSRVAEERRRYYAEASHDDVGIKENRWFDFQPCYFPSRQGNLFMIKQRFEWFQDDGPSAVNRDEHSFVDYNVQNQTPHGKILTMFSKSVLYNAVKNSLDQTNGFQPLPPIEALILPPVEKMKARYTEVFEKMRSNGKNFRTEVCQYALSVLKHMRPVKGKS